MTTDNPAAEAVRFAVVLKTYSWDDFVHRQASRCAAATGNGDFFISLDETNGSVSSIPFERVVRTSNADLVASGLPNRFEKGSLIWWNPDYVHYQFCDLYPDYDYYVFVEYDALVHGSFEPMVERAAAMNVDLVSLPINSVKRDWFWTPYHRQTYRLAELQGSLIAVTVFSRRALNILGQRRREMGTAGKTRFWPNAEVFLPTEIARNNLRHCSLAEFGSIAGYSWFPPMLEEDLPAATEMAFLHPVLDKKRYIRSILKWPGEVVSFFKKDSEMRLMLSRFSPEEYMPLLIAAARRRLYVKFTDKLDRYKLRLIRSSLL